MVLKLRNKHKNIYFIIIYHYKYFAVCTEINDLSKAPLQILLALKFTINVSVAICQFVISVTWKKCLVETDGTLHNRLEWYSVLSQDLVSIIHNKTEESQFWDMNLEAYTLVPHWVVTCNIKLKLVNHNTKADVL